MNVLVSGEGKPVVVNPNRPGECRALPVFTTSEKAVEFARKVGLDAKPVVSFGMDTLRSVFATKVDGFLLDPEVQPDGNIPCFRRDLSY